MKPVTLCTYLLLAISLVVAMHSLTAQRPAPCEDEGRCTRQGRDWIATRNEDCANSTRCETHGRCTADSGRCVVGSDADCLRTAACNMGPFCTARNGRCVATDESCRASLECEMDGRCTASADGRSCIALSDEDCLHSVICGEEGACVARDGGCAPAAEETCSSLPACADRGECAGRVGHCRATEDSHCEGATICQQMGACVARGGRCVPTAETCQRSEACHIGGACSLLPAQVGRGPHCGAGTDADCAQSTGCRTVGNCQLGQRHGGPACVPSAAGCVASSACTTDGRCGLVMVSLHASLPPQPFCRPRGNEDCTRSEGCREHGRCAAREHVCQPTLQTHCANSGGCRARGECQLQTAMAPHAMNRCGQGPS